LTLDLLRLQFAGCDVSTRLFSFRDAPYINLDEILSIDAGLSAREVRDFNRARIPLVKTHRLPSFNEPFQYLNPVSEKRLDLARNLEQNAFKIFVYRDIKSTMVSLYYFIPKSERGGDIHEFIRQVRGKREFSRVGFWAYQMARWMEYEGCLLLNYTSLLKDTELSLQKIGLYLHEQPLMQIPLLPEPPKSLLSRRGNTLFSQKPSSTAIMSFEERRFSVDSFTEDDDRFIASEIASVAPGLLNHIDCHE
jgi:hypothetical protein